MQMTEVLPCFRVRPDQAGKIRGLANARGATVADVLRDLVDMVVIDVRLQASEGAAQVSEAHGDALVQHAR